MESSLVHHGQRHGSVKYHGKLHGTYTGFMNGAMVQTID